MGYSAGVRAGFASLAPFRVPPIHHPRGRTLNEVLLTLLVVAVLGTGGILSVLALIVLGIEIASES